MTIRALVALMLSVVAVLLSAPARADLDWQRFYGSTPEANAVREHFAFDTRAFLHGHGREFVPTSGHRTNSDAHKNGAFDYRSRDLNSSERHSEAKALSAELGQYAFVIAEEYVAFDPSMGSLAANASGLVVAQTTYVNGQRGNTKFVAPGSDFAPHTHVQPNRPAAQVAAALGLTPTTGSEARFNELIAPAPSAPSGSSSSLFSGSGISLGNFTFPSIDLGLGALTPDAIAEGIMRAVMSGGRAAPGFGGSGGTPGFGGGGPGPRQTPTPQVTQPIIQYPPEVLNVPLL